MNSKTIQNNVDRPELENGGMVSTHKLEKPLDRIVGLKTRDGVSQRFQDNPTNNYYSNSSKNHQNCNCIN
eukprot:4505740-Amphidinium_carterae.1